ncbi:MAG: tetratricopeptide repeat protein [Oligoflexia bacterium]|nr:tetratricopeptide repeat protein [Oligoflexia bacterium]
MRKLLLLAILFSAFGCSSAGVKKEKAQLHLRIGTQNLMKGFYPQALKELIEAEKHDPEDPVIQNNLGLAYFVRKEFDRAQIHISKAVQLNPNYTDARNNLGRVFIEMAKYDSAIQELLLVGKDLTYPQPEKAMVNLGIAYMKKGEQVQAQEAFRKALESNGSFCPAHNYFGQSLFKAQKFAEASQAFESALQNCGNKYDEAHYFSGLTYYKLGQKEKAVARLEEVVKNYPTSEYATKAKSMLKIIQ